MEGSGGEAILLEHHRGNDENGMSRATSRDFDKMLVAPEDDYVNHGCCGRSSIAAKVGKSYFSRVTGHTESTRGYGKIHIKDVVLEVPEGIEIRDNTNS